MELKLPETPEQKIKTAGILARIFMFFACVFIGGAMVVHIMTGQDTNVIAGTGLVFAVIFLVFIVMRRTAQKELDVGSTFHQNGR